MKRREPARTVDDTAAAWAARIDRGLTGAEREALDRWLGEETRHVGALARARAIWAHAERSASLGPMIAQEARQPAGLHVDRRTMAIGGGALAAGLAGLLAVPAFLRRPRRIDTGVGELRRVALGDGSSATLDTDTRLETAFTPERRLVRLIAGEAYFEVAHEPLRPFVVEARGMAVQAVGTAFSVRAIAGLPVAVIVSEGKVAVSRIGTQTPPAMVAANMQALAGAVAEPPRVSPIDPDTLGRVLAWRDGMLAFQGETLREAVARFGRYGGPRITVDDPALAGEPISGLFAASDPKGFARAIAVSLDARVIDDGPGVRLVRERR